MQKEPIRDLDVVRAAVDLVMPEQSVTALLGPRAVLEMRHCLRSVAVAVSGTSQLASYNGLLTFIGDFLMKHRGVFASEELYDEIRDVVRPHISALRQSTTPEELQSACKALYGAIATLATATPAAGDEPAVPAAASDADRIQALEQENLQLHRRIAELEAARRAYASEFPLTEDGEPDVGNIHANIRKMKADLAKAL